MASPAAAVQTHLFEGVIGVGELSSPGGLAVDNSNGDVYVADAGLEAVVRYDSNGVPAEFPATATNAVTGLSLDASASQVAVAQAGPSAGDFYVTNSFGGGLQGFTSAGAPATFSGSAAYISGNTLNGTPDGGYSEACGVAVDGSGAIYVGDYGGFVDVYAPGGEFLTQLATPEPCAVAVDSAGNVYANTFAGGVNVFSPSSFPVSASTTYAGPVSVIESPSFGVAVDGADDQLYVDQGDRIAQLDSFAEGNDLILTFGAAELEGESRGVTIDRSGGSADGGVYASKPGEVDHFGPLMTIPPGPPVVHAESATAAYTEAELEASVDPSNAETTYFFEYGPTPAYGSRTAERTIPDGNLAVNVAAHLVGLTPGGTYHFRIVLSNSVADVAGEDRTFSTVAIPGPDGCGNASIRALQGSASLPNCRAYEEASPPDKNGTDVKDNDSVQAAASGGGAVFSSLGSFADSPSGTVLSYYRTERAAQGWTVHGISPPVLPQGGRVLSTSMMAVSPDLSTMVMRSYPAPPSAPGEQQRAYDFYRRDLPGGQFENLTPQVPEPAELEGNSFFAEASEAMGTVGINSTQGLTLDAPAGELPKGYVWQGGELHYVGVLPDASLAPESLVGGLHGLEAHNAISSNGSRVVFTAVSPGVPRGVYVREDLATTVEASGSQRVPPEPTHQPAEFQGASDSGDRVFFLSTEQLLNSDTDSGNDLYVFEPGDESLRRISIDAESGDGEEAAVVRVLGMGEDGARVYFAASGRLVAGQPDDPGMHIYAWSDSGGTNGSIAYVTSLDPTLDSLDWEAQISNKDRRVQVSRSGRYLLLTASTPISSFDNGMHTELYRYDSDAGALACVSCNPRGAVAVSDASMFGLENPVVNGLSDAGFSPRNVTDGGRVFFQTADPLALGDSNGVEDVYMWEDGSPALISSGRSTIPSGFGDASASGDDAFFLTGERLVSTDTDNNVDLYDARVDGGIGAQNPTPPVICEGEGCKAEQPSAPVLTVPGSSQVSGPGNHPPHRHRKRNRHKVKHHKNKHQRAGRRTSR
ncbi:MAG TPA: hypothetical protein VNS60_05530 [Solirubrobacterales bacterium]|nr:hypothetical protein [Solirubrobacterales bacterium]